MTLIDSHCHLDFIDNPTRVMANAEAVGVERVIVPGVLPSQWERLLQLRAALPQVSIAAGLHPVWIAQCDTAQREPHQLQAAIATWQRQHRGIAIGECGLDGMIDTPMAEQEHVLEAQIVLAIELGLPLILHCRRAHNPMLRLLKRYRPSRGGVLHAFSGSREIAEEYWALGFYLGVGGTITYPRANKTRNSLAAMPLDALVLETDAPDMPLRGRQGQPNLPSYLPEVAATLAELKGLPVADIMARTTDNSRHLFQLA